MANVRASHRDDVGLTHVLLKLAAIYERRNFIEPT